MHTNPNKSSVTLTNPSHLVPHLDLENFEIKLQCGLSKSRLWYGSVLQKEFEEKKVTGLKKGLQAVTSRKSLSPIVRTRYCVHFKQKNGIFQIRCN